MPELPTLSNLGKAAVVGLMGALAVGGAALILKGAIAIFLPLDCGPNPTSQCVFEQGLSLYQARRQVLIGGALLLLALALFVWIKPKFR